MSELVESPEDWFSHDTAHIWTDLSPYFLRVSKAGKPKLLLSVAKLCVFIFRLLYAVGPSIPL